MDLLEKASQTARALCAKLTHEDAKDARSVLIAVLEMPLIGGCVPECCSASYVRAVEIEAKCEVLAIWKRLDPDAAIALAPSLVAQLVAPLARRLALGTLELIERSPEACRVHVASVIDAVAHPRWQAAEAAARCLARLGVEAEDRVRAVLAEALGHEQWQVRRAAAKALGAVTGGPHERLEEAAQRDGHAAVRHAARKAIEKNAPKSA